jgi:soluble lytic murein transglycosylase
MARPGARESVDLLRAGLPELAREEIAWALGEKPHERWDRETLLFASHLLERADDLHRSHDLLRRAFMASYPALVSGNRPLFLHAWPRAFSAEVDAAARPYSWPPLLLQGLVREESAFSPAITSSAGAVGLTQLMWPTAKETARRMGRKLSRAELEIPAQNLEIGARYFDGLVSRWQGQLPLAVASYNAGPGAVSRWLDERGDLELAGFVETIPYDETRNYVKRVVGSWQAYHALHGADDGAPFVALEVGPVAAAVKAGAAPKAAGTGEPVNY